jgi:DNA-binding response OmpR family regulator
MADRLCILVVDDDVANRRVMQRMLSLHSDVLEADSGSAALSHLRGSEIALVLLDVTMPGQDGFAICRLIKQLPRDVFLPVLLVTGLDGQQERIRGLEAGADDFLVKPIARDELLLRVRAFLRLREQERTILSQVKELRRLEVLKDGMASLLVHDLRTPLAGILSSVGLALQGIGEGVVRDAVLLAQESAEALRSRLDETLQVRMPEESALPAHR